MKRQITISRYSAERVRRKSWKDLIFALVMCGYEVYADEDRVVFELGNGDEYKEVNK